ncbi:hypothetical protein CRUP_033822 [Coryphaenoides rupestris]|nr:hypothetical protein CRUP_033822 [Coryphaenoides rupestris]
MQKLSRSFLHQMSPGTAGGSLRQTIIRKQLITEIKVPPGTRIRVNNNRHRLWPSPPELLLLRCHTLLHHQLPYNLLNLNSEHFVTFVRYGRAVCTQVGLTDTMNSHTLAWESRDRGARRGEGYAGVTSPVGHLVTEVPGSNESSPVITWLLSECPPAAAAAAAPFDMQRITLEELKHILFHAFRDHLTMKDIENIITNEEESLKENSGNCVEFEGGQCVCVCVCVQVSV